MLNGAYGWRAVGYYLIAEGEAGRPEGREAEGGKGGTGGDPREGGKAAGTRRGGGQDYQASGLLKKATERSRFEP